MCSCSSAEVVDRTWSVDRIWLADGARTPVTLP